MSQLLINMPKEYGVALLTFGMTVLGAFLTSIIVKRKKKNRLVEWKREKINFGFYSKESEYSKDEIFQELWEENEKHKKQLKEVTKKYASLGWWFTVVYFIIADRSRNKDFLERKHRKIGIDKVEIEGNTITITFNKPLRPQLNKQVYPIIE